MLARVADVVAVVDGVTDVADGPPEVDDGTPDDVGGAADDDEVPEGVTVSLPAQAMVDPSTMSAPVTAAAARVRMCPPWSVNPSERRTPSRAVGPLDPPCGGLVGRGSKVPSAIGRRAAAWGA